MVYGHGSHQNGLDADIFFKTVDAPLTPQEISNPEMPSVVSGREVNPQRWSWNLSRLLEIAAKHPRVDRIFVNPAIKHELCQKTPSENRDWLRKLRPWWGHDDHFHVRLTCPEGSVGCVQQPEPPQGDGCGWEVESWLERPTLNLPQNRPNTRVVRLPDDCQKILKR